MLLENWSYWLTVFAYVIAFYFITTGLTRDHKNWRTLGVRFILVGVVLHTVLVIVRWIHSGHPPVTDVYELNMI